MAEEENNNAEEDTPEVNEDQDPAEDAE